MMPVDEWMEEELHYPVEAYARYQYQREPGAKKEYPDFLSSFVLGHAQAAYGKLDDAELESCLYAAMEQRKAFEESGAMDEKRLYAILDMVLYIENDGQDNPYYHRFL